MSPVSRLFSLFRNWVLVQHSIVIHVAITPSGPLMEAESQPPKSLPIIISSGFLVFRDAPRRSFLLMRHADRWDIPKGHVDPGESLHECALRELFEETGIQENALETDPSFMFTSEYDVHLKRYGNVPRRKRLVVFLATLNRPVEIKPTEHLGFEWFDWNPPHRIQAMAIDPLLAAVEEFHRAAE